MRLESLTLARHESDGGESHGDFHRQRRFSQVLNVLLGAQIVVVAWLLGGFGFSTKLNDAIVGPLIEALSLPRGPVREH